MAQSVNFAPNDYAVQQGAIDRRRRMAEMLQQQGATPIDPGRMAGGYVVPVSPIEGLAKMAQSWAAGRMQNRADESSRDLVKQRQSALADTLTRFQTAAQGAPAQDMGADPLTGESMGVPAQGPDRGAAMAALTSNPEAIQFARLLAPQMFAESKPMAVGRDQRVIDPATGKEIVPMAPQQPKMQRVEIPDGKGGMVVGVMDMNSPNPLSTFQPAGAQPARMEMVSTGGSVTPVNPYQPPAGPIEKTPEIPAGFTRGPNGQLVADPGYVRGRSEIARAGAPRVNTTVVNEGPKAFAREAGKMDAEQLGELRKAAMASQASLGTVSNMRSAIDRGVYSGGTANLQTQAASIINGITGLTPKGLPGSELFNAEASKLVLDHVKTLGANPSNADREFIEKTVPRLASSPEARNQLISYLEEKATRAITTFQEADKYARANNGLGGFPLVQQPAGGAPTPTPDRRSQPRSTSGRVVVDY